MILANKAARERMCISCRKSGNKADFIRIAKLSDGEVTMDSSEGRGAYLCKDTACVLKAQKERRIERALKTKIEAEVYEKLLNLSEGTE